MRQIAVFVAQSANPEKTALAFAQQVFKRLYERNDQDSLQQAMHCLMLEALRNVVPDLDKELTRWWAVYEDKRLSKPMALLFIQYHLFHLPMLDAYLTEWMLKTTQTSQGPAPVDIDPMGLDVGISLISQALLQARHLNVTDVPQTLEALRKILLLPEHVISPAMAESVNQILERVAGMTGLREKVLGMFEDWIGLSQVNDQSAFISKIHSQGLLSRSSASRRLHS